MFAQTLGFSWEPSALGRGWHVVWPVSPTEAMWFLLGCALHTAGVSHSASDHPQCWNVLQWRAASSRQGLEWQFNMQEWGAMDSAARQREQKTGTVVPDSCHLLWLLSLLCSTHCTAPSAAAGCSLECAESRENKLQVSENVVGWDKALVGV